MPVVINLHTKTHTHTPQQVHKYIQKWSHNVALTDETLTYSVLKPCATIKKKTSLDSTGVENVLSSQYYEVYIMLPS